jgi:very-short-patch-repair endonuclease
MPAQISRIERARELRREQTKAERRLWAVLRGRQLCGFKFRRQHSVDRYVADFLCLEAKLIIELDGGQHYSEDGMKRDEIRDNYLAGLGFTVLRFSDRDVLKNMDGVLQRIYEHL